MGGVRCEGYLAAELLKCQTEARGCERDGLLFEVGERGDTRGSLAEVIESDGR